MSVEMKDSGINGIGLIPNSWHTKKLGVFFTENSKVNYAFSSSNALQFKYGEIIQKANNNRELEEQEIELLKRYIIVEPNDIVVNGLNLNYDFNSLRIARVKESGIITSAYIVLRPKFDGDTSFFNYLLKTLDNQKIFHGMGVGIRLTLKFKELRSILIPVPPHEEEQSRIANFLDKKCAEIDGLIALQEQMIAQLNTYKQAVITETVIKGLDPNVKMKDSGVEWIGEIPEHWEVSRVGMHFIIILGKMLCNNQVDDTYTLESYFCAANVHFDGVDDAELKKMWFSPKEKSLYKVNENDLLVVEGGAGAGGCAIVTNIKESIYVQNSIMIVRPKTGNVTYLKYLLESLVKKGYIDIVCNKATIPHFTKDKLSSVPYPVISLSEQQTISNYLDQKCKEIDELISIKQEKIEQLKAYKKSVIFEYVTGKKQVV